MNNAVFIRLLGSNNKDKSLHLAIKAIVEGEKAQGIHILNHDSFHQIPGTPFAYWASDNVRRKFVDLPPFEGNGRTVKQGLATADDFRFVRAWWEVSNDRIATARQDTYQGKPWVPFAKGGSFALYYSDLPVVVNWENEGAEIRTNLSATGKVRSNVWMLRDTDRKYFFTTGLTFPRRTKRFSPRILPSGSIFGHGGQSAFSTKSLVPYIGILSSATAWMFLTLLLGASGQSGIGMNPQYETGTVQRLPVPTISQDVANELSNLVIGCIEKSREWDAMDECSHAYCGGLNHLDRLESLGALIESREQQSVRLGAEISELEKAIDALSARAYGVTDEDLHNFLLLMGPGADTSADENGSEDGDDIVSHSHSIDPTKVVAELASYVIGCVFGRWDIRMATNRSLIPRLQEPTDTLPATSPAMLLSPSRVPVSSGSIVSESWLKARHSVHTAPNVASPDEATITNEEYLLRVAWDGILIDDPQHPSDIVRRMREVLTAIWFDRAGEIETEASELLGIRGLRDYVSNPRRFFDFHLKQYSRSRRKAPIYWPLSTASGSYTVWLYYPRLTSDTIYTVVNKYLHPKIASVDRSIADMNQSLVSASGGASTRLQRELESEQELRRELIDMRDELLRIADLPFRPNLDDGVIINAAPFHRLFRHRGWAKATEDIWNKLERGEYDWAHLAYAIWPDRVCDVCRSDKSIAIAHDLEDLYVEAPAKAKKGKGRARQRALAEEDV